MRKITKITDIGTIWQAAFEDDSNGIRTVEAGQVLTPAGSIAAAVRVGTEATVMFYNSTAGVLYVKFGATSGVTAPTGAADGLPVLAGQIAWYNAGANPYVISNGAVNAYIAAFN